MYKQVLKELWRKSASQGVPTPQIAHSPARLTHGSFGPTRIHAANGILIGRAISTKLMVMPNKNTQTARPIAIRRIFAA